jgi:hypothetical protein
LREEVISEKCSELLGRLAFGDEVLSWVTTALRESHADEQKEHEAAITRLQIEHDRLRARVHAAYLDKLDGRIDGAFYAQMAETWQEEQDKLMREITRHQAADRSYLEEGARLIDLAHSSQHLCAKQEPHEQRRLLNFVLSNSTWKNGELAATYRQPFDLIAEAAAIAAKVEGGGALNSPGHPVWLGN